VRVVAATNLNMKQAIRDGRFREDLFYRLNTVPVFIPPLRERKEDVVLLFRKFASDFADKYRMPPIRLTENAKHMIAHYYWPGNIRQLKNITEQISVIEQQREITPDILRIYLPDEDTERLPALFTGGSVDHKTFSNEREILYQVLFDMKKDMNDLKKLVHDIMNGQLPANQSFDVKYPATLEKKDIVFSGKDREVMPETKIFTPDYKDDPDELTYQVAEEFQETDAVISPVSLEEMEKQMIQKTLEKFRGRRKAAADELKISERTLYRKIKEYGLE
jgi:DNA-binding NtrC family response regulator